MARITVVLLALAVLLAVVRGTTPREEIRRGRPYDVVRSHGVNGMLGSRSNVFNRLGSPHHGRRGHDRHRHRSHNGAMHHAIARIQGGGRLPNSDLEHISRGLHANSLKHHQRQPGSMQHRRYQLALAAHGSRARGQGSSVDNVHGANAQRGALDARQMRLHFASLGRARAGHRSNGGRHGNQHGGRMGRRGHNRRGGRVHSMSQRNRVMRQRGGRMGYQRGAPM